MEHRRLGSSGLQLSAIGLGGWATFGERLSGREAMRVLAAARSAGITLFDNAETYAGGRSEEAMGRAIRRLRWPRDSFAITSKVFWGTGSGLPLARGLNRKHVVEACHAALRRLRVEHLDLYLCHRPDPHAPLEETVAAMTDLVRQGKILYWGTSEWPAASIQRASAMARRRSLVAPVTEQAQYNVFVRRRVEQEYAPLYDRLGLGLMAWSPLAYGVLAGRYGGDGGGRRGRLDRPGYAWLRETILDERADRRLSAARELGEIARELDRSPAALALAWVLSNARVGCAVMGASSARHVEENVTALELLPLDLDVRRRLDGLIDPV